MNFTFEQKNTRPSMAEMKAMQQTALSRSIDKAGTLQKAVTLTEENWTGLTGAVALTGESMLRLEERETLGSAGAVADVSADSRSGAVGIGAASVLAGLSAMDDEDEEPEERLRKMEAKATAQNLGAAIGLVAGAVIAASEHKPGAENDSHTNEQTQTWQQTM